ncbi:MAG: hypothetical protein Q9161_009355 [Pseudevernia consocians]
MEHQRSPLYYSAVSSFDKELWTLGTVFRVSPNELSFSSVASWKDIYGYKSEAEGKETHTKSDFYRMYGSGYDKLCIGSEQNPMKHSLMLRNLAPAFSTRALLDQEFIINQCVDRFIERIMGLPLRSTKGLDMTEWFGIFTFDLFGEMSFGESFKAIEQGMFRQLCSEHHEKKLSSTIGEPHFWPKLVTSHLFFITVLDNLRRYPWLAWIGSKMLPWMTTAVRDKHSGYTRQKLQGRLDKASARKDFLSELIVKVENGEVDKEEMTAHVSTLVIAGGETTATFFASMTAFLLKTPEAYKKLIHEIRSSFGSYDDISVEKAQTLPYLQAVIAEGLRIHPPGSYGFPRLSPGAVVDGRWIPAGVRQLPRL